MRTSKPNGFLLPQLLIICACITLLSGLTCSIWGDTMTSIRRNIIGTSTFLHLHRCKQLATHTKQTYILHQQGPNIHLQGPKTNQILRLPKTVTIPHLSQKIGFTGQHTSAYAGRISIKEGPIPIKITVPVGKSRIRYYGF